MTTKTQTQLKKGLIYALNIATVDETYEFKYELSGAIDEVIDSIRGLKNIIDAWMPLGPFDYPPDMMDEQDSGPLPF